MARIPTVKVQADNPRGYNIINRWDFDAEEHALHADNDPEDFEALGVEPPETVEEGSEEGEEEPEEGGEGQDTGEEEEATGGSSEPLEEGALTLADLPAGDLLASKYDTPEEVLADLESDPDEILAVTGIGPATLDEITDFVNSLG